MNDLWDLLSLVNNVKCAIMQTWYVGIQITLKEFPVRHAKMLLSLQLSETFACSLTAEKLFNNYTFISHLPLLLSDPSELWRSALSIPIIAFMATPPTGIFSWNNICVEDHHTLFHLRSICPYYLQATRLFKCNLSFDKGYWLMLIGALRNKRHKYLMP